MPVNTHYALFITLCFFFVSAFFYLSQLVSALLMNNT